MLVFQILEKQVLETEDMKSIIEHLNHDKEQLVRDKSKEVEQVHRVIEKQKKELALVAPVSHKVGDSQDNLNNFAPVEQVESLQNKLKNGSRNYLVNRREDDNNLLLNSSQKQLQGQLEIVLADRETLQKLPEGKKSQFKAEEKILGQNLHNIQETSRQQFSELITLQLQYKELQEEHKLLKLRLAQRDNEMTMSSSCIQEFEDKLRERETKVVERFQIDSEQKVEQTVEVQHINENVQLENKPHVLTQTLHDKEVTYQREVSELQAAVAEFKSQTEKQVEELEALRFERDFFHSYLKPYKEKDQNNDQKETEIHKPVPSLGAYVPSEETEEEGEERKSNDKLSVSAGFSYRDKLVKDIPVTNLKTSKDLNIQDKKLKGILLIQEAEITNAFKKHQTLQPLFQQMWQLNHLSQSPQLTQKIMDNFKCIGMDKTSWDSPEIMRKLNNSMKLQTSLPGTPFSEVDPMHSIGFEDLYPENSVVQGDHFGLLECPIPYLHGNEKTASSLFQSLAFPRSTVSVPEYDGVPESISVRDAEGFTLMPPELQDDIKPTMPRLESANTEYGSNTSSDLIFQLNWKDPETTIYQDGNVMAYLPCFGVVPDVTEPAMKEREFFSQQLKNVLKMVYEESYKILVLSEKSLPLDDGDDEKNVQQAPSMEEWQRERLTLLDAVQSLKDYLNSISDKEDKENASAFFDWRGELLQAVQCVLEKERNMLQNYLQSHFHNSGSRDKGSLVENLEHIVEQQEQRQKIALEHLLSSDRNSLLTEIQDLEAQLRLVHLQSKEKLQQLQDTLTNTENLGSKQEHQLRRQVELLEYNLQQEKLIASDLQASVQREQEKASEVNELLKEKHTAILNLKSELCESKQTNERLEKSLQELQREVIKCRSALENKNVFQDLQNEQLKEEELQNMLDEQQHQHKRREDEKSKAIEELQAALELQCIQNNQLSVALEHEQSTNINLRKKLQIEHSRCEALLSQDQNKLLELQKNVDAEKNRSFELLSALNHERVLTEQLSMGINECRSCKHKDLLQELQAQLFIERSYARELLAIIEKTQQQALNSKNQMDEMQRYCEEPQKKQNYTSLQVTQATLQNQKRDIIHTLDIQREKEVQLKKEWEQLQPVPRVLRDQEHRPEQGLRERWQQRQQMEHHKLKELQKAPGSQHEFKVQHWKNAGRIQELQKMLEDLEGQETLSYKNLQKPTSCPSKNDYSNLTFSADPLMLHVEQQKLENIREQLLFAAAYLSECIYKTVDRTIKWPASNDEAAAALLYILELKAELLTPSKPPVIPTCIINSMEESERIACQEEKSVLQNGLKATENDATKMNFVLANKSTMASPNLKMQKLYRKYLRAESFRKALIYQKKYLLLLLGGFQECEQATLSLIARMGIYPSTDLNMSKSRSRSFTKFRSAVRAVTAISRLKFLMKKWNKAGRKEMPPEAISATIANKSYPGARTEVLKQQKPFPGYVTQEAGYCNRSNSMRLVSDSPKSPHHLHNRFISASQASSKDPEHSLTEYIARLETVQRRLGILMPGQSRL